MYSLLAKRSSKIGLLFLTISACFIGFLIIILCDSAEAADHIVINEVCSNNFSVICDQEGEYLDYIELYNPANVPVSLTGFSLSDNEKELRKCNLDSVIIPAKGYYIVWLKGSGTDKVGYGDFKLSKSGETLYLSNAKGVIIDSVELPEMKYNTVFGRIDEGGADWACLTPTAGMSNRSAKHILQVSLEKPRFSVESGFYDEELTLIITGNDDEIIYYTLDGSDPTTESFVYKEPIVIGDASENENVYAARTDLLPIMEYIPSEKVDKATVVRAIAYNKKSDCVSEIETATYFVGYGNKEDYKGYPVLSLVTDPNNLFDAEDGIYGTGNTLNDYIKAAGKVEGKVPEEYTDENGNTHYLYMASNAFNTGKKWEREANIAYFDEEHRYEYEQNVGIRISGQSTRNAAQKSFNIFARDIYDESDILKYSFFDNMEYSSVKLRNGGSDHAGSKFMDAFLQQTASARNVAIQDSSPCVVFLNGEYWGIYNIRERYKEDYFENHFNVSRGNVWMIDSGAISIGSWEAYNDYEQMLDFVKENDMSITANYEKICNRLDIQSLIDFYCIQIYCDNTDVGFDKNIALWRSIQTGEGEYEDGRWRLMLYDMDGALGSPDHNTFEQSEWWKENFSLMDEILISNLLKNEEFKTRFIDSFIEIAAEDFAYDKVHEELMNWDKQYETQAVKSHQRFLSAEADTEQYREYIEKMDTFFKERHDYIIMYLKNEMGLDK